MVATMCGAWENAVGEGWRSEDQKDGDRKNECDSKLASEHGGMRLGELIGPA